tara:strand:- start:298 stop:417 length:120 start_codon:yes stop_codon:yes gene_type:complete
MSVKGKTLLKAEKNGSSGIGKSGLLKDLATEMVAWNLSF